MSKKFEIKKIIFVAFNLFLIFSLTSCVKRTVTINSQPQGAKVYFYNESEAKGVTPCTFDFTFYGTYPIKLVKEGYQDLNTSVFLKAPVYEYFPIDLFSETIFPAELKDKHEITYKLTVWKEEK